MDDQQQQRLNEAAEKFANALKESYQVGCLPQRVC